MWQTLVTSSKIYHETKRLLLLFTELQICNFCNFVTSSTKLKVGTLVCRNYRLQNSVQETVINVWALICRNYGPQNSVRTLVCRNYRLQNSVRETVINVWALICRNYGLQNSVWETRYFLYSKIAKLKTHFRKFPFVASD